MPHPLVLPLVQKATTAAAGPFQFFVQIICSTGGLNITVK